MRRSPAEVYAIALDGGRLFMLREDGRRLPAPVGSWLGPPGRADERVLKRAVGPVLDVGCGPGRHVLALARRGIKALGVDIAPAAVRHARGRGAEVMLGSVFAPVPGAGRWRTALLLDGNIGIGGKPLALLARLRTLLAPGGQILCELDPPGSVTGCELIALEDGRGTRSTWFGWAHVSLDGLAPLARAARLDLQDVWAEESRWFAALEVAGVPRRHQIVPKSSSTTSAWTASHRSTAGSRCADSEEAAAAQARGTNGSQIRSVSAFVNPSPAAATTVTTSATAAGSRRLSERRTRAAIGGPSINPQATGDPNTQ